jgi:hypothetical protein
MRIHNAKVAVTSSQPSDIKPASAPTVDANATGTKAAPSLTATGPAVAHAASWSSWIAALAPKGPLAFLTPAQVESAMLKLRDRGVDVVTIGKSQEGRAMYAGTVGHGPTVITVMAAAHPDEPTGTLTGLHLLEKLGLDKRFAPLLDRMTLHVVPCANPDGAARNAGWFSSWTSTPDLRAYFMHVARDLPAADVEFGFPESKTDTARPEDAALAGWLDDVGHSDHHASLHSMFLGGGALFLVTAQDLEPRKGTLRFLLGEADATAMPLHDKDRMGQKGFFRIGPGLQTAPTAQAMRAFFANSSSTTAQAFKLNSMQYAAKNLSCPFALVSEIPLVYDPRISSMKPAGVSRASEEQRFANALLQMADRVQSVVDTTAAHDVSDAAKRGLDDVRARLTSVRNAAHAQLADLARYGTQEATEGILVENDLNLVRREATLLAGLARHLDGTPDAAPVLAQLDDLVTALRTRFTLRFPPIEVQMRLQIASVLAGALGQAAPTPTSTFA